jgi:hypothetical protein
MSHLSFGNPFSINNKDICVQSNPKLKGITVSFNTVKLIFEKLEGNFKKAIVFNNPLFKLGVRNNNYVNITVLDNKLELGDIYKLSKLKMDDFLNRNRIKSCVQLEREFGINIDYNVYMKRRVF